MTDILIKFSDQLAAIAVHAGSRLAAIRVGPNQHLTGILWKDQTILTTDQALPPRDAYSVVLPGGGLASAQIIQRNMALNIAVLRLDQPIAVTAMALSEGAPVGALVVVLGADTDASSTLRLAAVHRGARANGLGVTLDLPENRAEPGALVIDATGAILGMLTIAQGGAQGDIAVVIPHQRFGDGQQRPSPKPEPLLPPSRPTRVVPRPTTNPTTNGADRRAWLGVALQPITVPDALVSRAGQASGRLVVGISQNGPAEQAGLRLGDVLLALDGHSTSGQNALRTLLKTSQVGRVVEIRILRDTTISTVRLTVAAQP